MDSRPTIDDLPPELLSKIFVSCIDTDTNYARHMQVPITLGLVCRKWRETALQTHDLWASISFRESISHSQALELNTPALNRWIARSGDVSCYVRLVKQPGGRSTLPTILHPIAHRIQILDLILSLCELRQLGSLFNSGFPRLEGCRLSLTEHDDDDDDDESDPGFSFAACQNLTSLDLTFAPEDIAGTNDTMAFLPSSLAYLRLELRELITLVYIITQFPNLASCIIDVYALSPHDLQVVENSNSKVLYSPLLSLTILSGQYDLRPILQYVQYPYLTYLRLAEVPDAEGILPVIAKASPPLTTLILWDFGTSSDELLAFLENLPTITSLTLVNCKCLDRPLILALALIPDRQRQYLPRLEDLRIRGKFGTGGEASHKDLVDMVESRWRVSVEGCSRLSKAKLELNSVLDASELPRVSEMQAEGLDIVAEWMRSYS